MRGALLGGAATLLALTACGSTASTTSSSTTAPAASANAAATGAQSSTGAASSTAPAASSTPAPAASSGQLGPVADRCQGRSFGPALAPKDQPSNVHVYSAAPAMQIDTSRLYEATISTAKGDIVLCLDPQLAPNTVNNFVVLARNHFYDGLTFHRVVADFVIQGGDPSGDGSGGPGYEFADEPVKGTYDVGTVAMANAGPNTNGSQFFICIGAQCAPLQPLYNLFGVVHHGQDVADAIAQGDVMTTVTVSEST